MQAIDFWSKVVNTDKSKFKYIYFKKNKVNTKRKNIGNGYNGLLRVRVRKSSSLNRKIAGWIEGIDAYCGVV